MTISHEEEISLCQRHRAGDRTASEVLIQAHMGWGMRVLAKYGGGSLPQEEKKSIIALGYLRALEKFDERRGLRFTTYAKYQVRRTLQDAKAVDRRLGIRIPPLLAQMQPYYYELKSRGEEPTVEKLCAMFPPHVAKLQDPENLARALIEYAQMGEIDPETIMPEKSGSRRPLTVADIAPDENSTRFADVLEVKSEVEHLLKRANLTDKEKVVIQHYYGLGGATRMNVREISETYGLTKAAWGHHKINAERKIREAAEKEESMVWAKGRKRSEEQKRKISEGMLRYHEERRRKEQEQLGMQNELSMNGEVDHDTLKEVSMEAQEQVEETQVEATPVEPPQEAHEDAGAIQTQDGEGKDALSPYAELLVKDKRVSGHYLTYLKAEQKRVWIAAVMSATQDDPNVDDAISIQIEEAIAATGTEAFDKLRSAMSDALKDSSTQTGLLTLVEHELLSE